MSINRLALIRYKAIDECLRNHGQQWTLDQLIERVRDILRREEGIDRVSKRTIQADIQRMRSNEAGYNAPIIVKQRKYYTYSDPAYSITTAPLNEADRVQLEEMIAVLKQLNGFSYLPDISEVIVRLEKILRKARGA
ncbi:hypothetical protein HGH93_13220 [Chitinophaga polysaccharea]|uniref:hypothetical protein n=1 Tax=Chitinophaga TaxID=79328 RepID=UPI00145511C6|nr:MULTISPECIES: hypothetical protein [Chitinophaga]NLR59069.1 hypothetical protein [Chitinophaga polysaccharea]NLU92160.1 hypothetical protein [Chitinophaga sp. Ak27]